MEFQELIRDAFVLVGYSSVGKWDGELVYPIPSLWKRAQSFIGQEGVEKIVGVCLLPRSNQYFYTCGIEIDSVEFHKVKEDMTLHTFPEQKYVVFTHRGQAKNIPLPTKRSGECLIERDIALKRVCMRLKVLEQICLVKKNVMTMRWRSGYLFSKNFEYAPCPQVSYRRKILEFMKRDEPHYI